MRDFLARLLPLRITFDVDPHHDAVLYWDHLTSLLGTGRPVIWTGEDFPQC